MAVLSGFHHVKMPVADVARSRDWYQRVLGFEQELEFVEDGVLMGLALRDPGGTAVALGVPTRADLEEWQRRLDELGEPHGGIVTGHAGSVLVGLHDPDGIEVRLYTMDDGNRRSAP
jgi:catechol 2,3-dioxygenase-like lactoylglutathione lyase family enzyme